MSAPERSTSVAVLAGGLSHEREVSLRSGRRVAEALRACGLVVQVVDADAALLPTLTHHRPDVVVPLLHGQAGEDGAVRDVLDLVGIPYVGSPAAGCRVAFDKPVAKAAVSRAGLSIPAGVVLPHATFRELGATTVLSALTSRLGLPLVVKPSRGGSALGLSVVRDAADLPAAMVAAFAYADTALVEQFIAGVEVAVSVVEIDETATALPAVEIVPDSGLYDYAARYTAGATEFFAPARLSASAAVACAEAALAAHDTLGLRDLSRTDLIVDRRGTPWFLETNVAPGMTETSLFPQAIVAAGLELGATLRTLVERAATRST